jgi:hypothetical protein
MPKITFNGVDHWVPGVYSREEVVSYLAGASATFQVPMLLGGSDVGYPYHFDSVKEADEDARGPFTYCGSTSSLREVFGDDSDLKIAFTYAKRHGLPNAYTACLAKLTRASVIANSAPAVKQFKIYSKLFGALGNYHQITYTAGNVMTITPAVKHTLLTVTTAAPDTRVYVRDTSWIVAGETLYIGSNAVTMVAKVVSKTGTDTASNGQKVQWVEFTAAVGAIFPTSGYAMLVKYDSTQAEVSGTFTTGQQIIDWINESKWLGATKQTATFTGALLVPTAIKPIKEIAVWESPVVGTSPAPSSTDYDDLITLLDAGGWEDFIIRYGVIPRLFCLVDDSSTIHGSFRDWAIAKRAEGYPIAIVSGCAWGDTALSASNDTNPIYRARALNSQDFQLVAGGLDYLDAYLSYAPAIFGMRAAGGPWHNLTKDPIIFSTREITWDERNDGDETALSQGGVVFYRLVVSNAGAKYVVSQGINTLQNNAVAWNTGTNDTPLCSQRDVADFCQREMRYALVATQLGEDEVDAASCAAVLVRIGDKLKRQGYMTDYQIVSVVLNDTGTGWDVTDAHKYPTTTDFLTITTQVVVGEE